MKKNVHCGRRLLVPHRSFLKMFLLMKMTIAMILLTTLQVTARTGNAQNVTLQMKQAEIPQVFRAIEKQSPYRFLYNYDLTALQKKVDVNVNNLPVTNVLDNLLSGSGLSYRIMNSKLVVIISDQTESSNESRKISGKIISETGVPLAGVSIRIKGSNFGAASDVKGNFSLEVPDNVTLVFSYVGYETQEIKLGNIQTLTITLKQTDRQLEQVVVVGYGVQKKKDLTGSVAVIGAKEMEDRPNTQFGYSIEGKAAGVQVIRSSGQPQAGFSIRVRGTSSITSGSDPLYIVDGVQTYNTNEINPADIESISILKDASSAAIYGSSGANGVVLITTKRGKNQKLKINFNTSITDSKAWKKMNVLNSTQFKDLATEMGQSTDWNKYNANTDWQNEIFRNALTQNYQLSAVGGTKKTSYYISGSAINQNGIVLNNNVKRATLKINVDHQLTKFLKLGTSLSYDSWKDIDVSENNRNGVITRLFTSIPNIGIRDLDNPAMYARSPFINDLENPVSTVYQPTHLFKNNRFHGNIYAEADVLKGLKIKSLFGFEKTKGNYTSFQDSIQTRYGKSMGGLATENNYKFKYWVSENTASYNTKINEHSIAALAGFIVSREVTDNLYTSSHDFSTAVNGNQSVGSGAVQAVPSPQFEQKSNVSFIGRLNYSYKDKYYLTSNFRVDGSGQFPPQNHWGYFPSFSGGWRISQENFLKNSTSINELKLRAGWGLVGNSRAPTYAWYGLVDTIANKYLIGGTNHTAFTPNTLENNSLKWEKTSQFDIGIDLAVLNNRLTFTADYYYKKTKDMLLKVPVPTSTGFSIALQNAGSLENKGFEFQVGSKNIVRNKFKWNSDFNISFNRNKVLSIVGNTIHSGTINPAGDDFNTAIVQEGMALGTFYGKISQGVDPTTGNINFLKTADNSGDSLGVIGNANPKFTYGFSNSFTMGNFIVNIFLQGVSGNQIFNATKILTESMALTMNQSATVLNRWKKPGDITDIPRSSLNDWTNSNPSTRYIENGSYLRLKSLTIGYNLPKSVLTKLRMTRCMIYFTSENLLTFTKYKGFDPEVSAFSGSSNNPTNQNTAPGVDYGTYPQSRDFILGLNISF
jgi:TonB-linked SusC/RagA family outer membrane protein